MCRTVFRTDAVRCVQGLPSVGPVLPLPKFQRNAGQWLANCCLFNSQEQTLAARLSQHCKYLLTESGLLSALLTISPDHRAPPVPYPKPLQPLSFFSLPPASACYITQSFCPCVLFGSFLPSCFFYLFWSPLSSLSFLSWSCSPYPLNPVLLSWPDLFADHIQSGRLQMPLAVSPSYLQ